MSDQGELMLNRLIVLLQVVAIPIYFIFFSVRFRDQRFAFFDTLLSRAEWLRPVLPEWMVLFLVNAGIPIFFSLPWVLGTVLRATKIANAYTLMGRALGKVRIDQKIFYGLNAAFTLVFFIFPFASPIITIIGIFVVMKILLVDKLKVGKVSKLIWIIPSLLLSFYPGLIVVAFYINYSTLLQTIIDGWNSTVAIIFGIGLCLAIAITLGNFFLFLFEGRAKYSNVPVNEGFILFLKGIFLGILLLLYFPGEGVDFVNIVNYIAVAFAFFEMIMRKRHNLNSDQSAGRGIIMVLVFSLVNMLINYLDTLPNFHDTGIIQTIVVAISGLIFFGLFAASYKYADDEELF